MTRCGLISCISVILVLSAHGAMAMDASLSLFPSSESKRAGVSTVGSSNVSAYADGNYTHQEASDSKNKSAIFVHGEISPSSELDSPETSLCMHYPKMSILIPWNFTAIHDGMNFRIDTDSHYVRAFKSSGEFKTYCYNNARFISLPTVDGQILIRHNPTSVHLITSDDIDVFQRCATMQSIKTLAVPLVDLTKVRQSFKMTNEGISIVVPQTKLMPTFTRTEDDSKSYCRIEDVTLLINSPFSFVLFTDTDEYPIIQGNVDIFGLLELYKGG